MCTWPGFPVVVGSPGGIAKHRVGSEDLLECHVGYGALRWVNAGAGVWVVPSDQRPVGVADLVLGGV